MHQVNDTLDFLFQPGAALDPAKYNVVLTGLFGGGEVRLSAQVSNSAHSIITVLLAEQYQSSLRFRTIPKDDVRRQLSRVEIGLRAFGLSAPRSRLRLLYGRPVQSSLWCYVSWCVTPI